MVDICKTNVRAWREILNVEVWVMRKRVSICFWNLSTCPLMVALGWYDVSMDLHRGAVAAQVHLGKRKGAVHTREDRTDQSRRGVLD